MAVNRKGSAQGEEERPHGNVDQDGDKQGVLDAGQGDQDESPGKGAEDIPDGVGCVQGADGFPDRRGGLDEQPAGQGKGGPHQGGRQEHDDRRSSRIRRPAVSRRKFRTGRSGR